VQEVTIAVRGMKCGGCAKNVENALKALPGVLSVAVDLKGAKVKLELDNSKTTVDQAKQKIREAGYKPE
jgi:copper chaperone CopZ